MQLYVLRAGVESGFAGAFASLVEHRAQALAVDGDPISAGQREHLVALADRHAVPAIYEWRQYAAAGGLMSYGPSLADAYRQVGWYIGMVLKARSRVNCQ
ncbi:MAG: hypothetical protein ACLQME_05200 [Alphaproteobacteria bacterium]